jgi:hypothetical protein
MASNDLAAFNRSLEEFHKRDVVDAASMLVRRVAFAIDRQLVMSTPVGNPDLWKRPAPKGYVGGRARANWIPTLNVPATAAVEKRDKAGAATMALLAPVTADFKLGDQIWLSSNIKYIQRLNEGHSTQAPAGFVELAIQSGLREAMR